MRESLYLRGVCFNVIRLFCTRILDQSLRICSFVDQRIVILSLPFDLLARDRMFHNVSLVIGT